MTSLAYIHACHSCYDERSIDQKKSVSPSFLGVFLVVLVWFWLGFGFCLFCLFCFGRQLAFYSHLFSNMWEWSIKDNTFG